MPPKILLIQLRQLGDILLTTPCIRELRRAWPEAKIDVLSHPMGKLILERNPYLNQHLCYDPQGGLKQAWQLNQKLRGEAYSHVLDFMYNPRSALYAWLTRSPRRLAFDSRRSGFFTEIVKHSPQVEYIVQEKFRYLRHLDIKPEAQSLDLPWDEVHTQPLLGLLSRDQHFATAPLRVAIAPTHRREERRWPVARYAKIADRLVQDWGASVIWLWGPGEEDFVRAVQALCTQPSQLAPKTSFRELAALMASCDLFVGNSNGPSHVAVAVDIPSLQLHGTTFAASWCPLSSRHRALQAGQGSETGRGPIAELNEQAVWSALEGMRPLLEKSAQSRQQIGVRMNWSPLTF